MSYSPSLATFAALSFVLVGSTPAAGQVRELAGAAPTTEIDGPPVPTGDAVVNQAVEGGVTIRAVRVNESLSIDGVIDESIAARVGLTPAMIRVDRARQAPGAAEPRWEQVP